MVLPSLLSSFFQLVVPFSLGVSPLLVVFQSRFFLFGMPDDFVTSKRRCESSINPSPCPPFSLISLFDKRMLFVLNYKAMKLVTAILITAGALSVDAWSSRQSHDNSRRQFLSTTTTTASGILSAFFVPSIRNAAATNTSPLIEELKESKAKLEAVPALLAKEEWEQVRTILKTPPVNKLWNLGDVSNNHLVESLMVPAKRPMNHFRHLDAPASW
jgi:hypothetical protein